MSTKKPIFRSKPTIMERIEELSVIEDIDEMLLGFVVWRRREFHPPRS